MVPAVMTMPCAVSESALMTWMLTRAPAGTMMAGLVRPTARNVSSGPPEGLASMVSRPAAVVKVEADGPLSPAAAAAAELSR